MEAINNAGSAVGILAKDGIVIAGTYGRKACDYAVPLFAFVCTQQMPWSSGGNILDLIILCVSFAVNS